VDKGGFFLVYRGVFPDFGNAPYTEREAWLWLIASAGYNNGNMGEIVASYNELGREWYWFRETKNRGVRPNATKVNRFLQKLISKGRITLSGEKLIATMIATCEPFDSHKKTIIINNYNKYQLRKTDNDSHLIATCEPCCDNDPTFPESSQDVTSPKQKRNNINKEKKKEEEQPPPPKKNKQKFPPREEQYQTIQNNLSDFQKFGADVDLESQWISAKDFLDNDPEGQKKTNIRAFFRNNVIGRQTYLNAHPHLKPKTSNNEIPLADQLRTELKRREIEKERLQNAF
jgi:hypothetical protein